MDVGNSTTDYEETIMTSSPELKPRMMTKKEPVKKSIVNMLAEEFIKEPKVAKNRGS